MLFIRVLSRSWRYFASPRIRSPVRAGSGDLEIRGLPGGLRISRVHLLQSCLDDLADGGVAHPFAVSRNDVPRSDFGGTAFEHGLVCLLEGVPQFPVIEVAGIELPAFFGIVEP